jgi:hypothetical protein
MEQYSKYCSVKYICTASMLGIKVLCQGCNQSEQAALIIKSKQSYQNHTEFHTTFASEI